ncbi:MAG: 4Fe-4S dicluster domain-containing protein [Acidobacteria bacterium]|nr:4Fe-4S dicluster domain-containing protein [Acidobacteriota bacterium]MBI3263630.1 4Fe-4S dicluster domain-containing protein [Acidobacteriota bacterium]
MPRWGLVIDLDRCTGCQACVVACKHENNVPFSTPAEATHGRLLTWIHLVPAETPGRVGPSALPLMCQHCDRPPCTDVCPTSATYLSPEGIVAQVYPRCIGCRYCTNACPYSVKVFNWSSPEWPGAMAEMRNPDVSLRPKGIVEKCTFCHHRLMLARERARDEGRDLAPDDYVPACVQTCPAEAMTFGDLDDPHGAVAALANNPRAFRLMEELGTKPKVIYLREGE